MTPIIELRQYTLHSGRRDDLIALFEREFVESQEALGMKVVGAFPDRGATWGTNRTMEFTRIGEGL